MDEEKKPVDGLEHIAKEAADKAQFDFNPEAWKAMEAKLNDADKTPFAWWKILFPIGVVVVLLLIFWPGNGGDTSATEEVTEPSKTEASVPASESEEGQPTSTSEITNPTESSEMPTSREVQAKTEENVVPVQQEVVDESPTNTAIANNAVVSTTPITGSTTESAALGTSALSNSISNSDKFTIEFAREPSWEASPKYFLGVPEVLVPKDSFGIIEEVKEEETDSIKRGGAWIFFAATDYSQVGSESSSDPGLMLGVLRESYIGKHWSFSFGLGYSVKKYSALGSDYETPYWVRNFPDAVESVLANCVVIDLPLNVRRYFELKKGNRLFVSSGLSTYFMVRETYDYTYDQPRPSWNTTWEIRNENKHFFGIANFSIGFETPIGKNLGLGIEPFVQVPLSGIGFGQVDLLSFGVKAAIKINK